MEYKILIIKNRTRDKVDFADGIKHLQTKTPLKINITELETDIDITFKEIGNGVFKGGVPANHLDFRRFVPEGKYNAVVLLYGNDCPYMRVATVENIPLYQDTEFVSIYDPKDANVFNHELIHCFFKKLSRIGIVLKDPMDTYENDKNMWAEASNRTKAIALLNPYWSKICAFKTNTTMNYKYFKPHEIVGLKPELVQMLDKAREIAGVPFKINSGFRTKEQNKKAGGVSDSAHLISLAVDIACTSDSNRWKIINSLIDVGFNRIGISFKGGFVHADIDNKKTPMVIWGYE